MNPGRMLGKAAGVSPGAHKTDSAPETPPLSRSGRKLADAIMAAAKFKPTADGSRLVRQYEVYWNRSNGMDQRRELCGDTQLKCIAYSRCNDRRTFARRKTIRPGKHSMRCCRGIYGPKWFSDSRVSPGASGGAAEDSRGEVANSE